MSKELTQFKPGNPGRRAGSKNKSIARMKLSEFVDNKWTKFETEMNGLKGRAYVENFIKLLPYIMPQYSAINFSLRNMSEDDLQFLIIKLREENESSTDQTS